VAIDLADVPADVLRRLPFTTWMRVQRVIEGSDTACVLTTPEPLARSAGGLTLTLTGQTSWRGVTARSRRVGGLDVTVRVVSPRRRVDGVIAVAATAVETTERRTSASLWVPREALALSEPGEPKGATRFEQRLAVSTRCESKAGAVGEHRESTAVAVSERRASKGAEGACPERAKRVEA
jgi:hypothetical protein